jgi:hypothetical protein
MHDLFIYSYIIVYSAAQCTLHNTPWGGENSGQPKGNEGDIMI